MYFRKFFGYALYPLLALLFLFPSVIRAQDSQQPSSAPPTQPADPAQARQSDQQSTPQDRAQVLRESQARVNARRRVRVRQIIAETYGHKYELNFAGGALRFPPGSYLQRINEAGWTVDMTDYVHGDLGIAADFRG